jgi:hypothetical protein
MRVTTVRFGTELWALLEEEAARDGTSVSQYIREAALARAAAAASHRGDAPFGLVSGAAREVVGDDSRADVQMALATLVRAQTESLRRDATALREEGKQVTRRTREMRAERKAAAAKRATAAKRPSSE